MANHKSSKKRILVTEKKNAVNTSRRSRVKTYTKKAIKAIESGDKAVAIAATRICESHIMKAAGKTMPKKRAARKVSRLAKKVNKMNAAA
jgi:small subunit ribosomal protein S20